MQTWGFRAATSAPPSGASSRSARSQAAPDEATSPAECSCRATIRRPRSSPLWSRATPRASSPPKPLPAGKPPGPPFGRLAAIVISSEDAAEAEATARRIARAAPRVDGMAVFGPAPAPLAMLRGRHRHRILVHAARALDVQDVIREWLGGVEWSAKVRVAVDVDPYSFL